MAGAVVDDVAVEETPETALLKVSGRSDPLKVASAIAHRVYAKKDITVRAIGAGAVNQAVKAIAVARGYVAQRGFDLACVPGFDDVPGYGGDDVTAVTLQIRVLR